MKDEGEGGSILGVIVNHPAAEATHAIPDVSIFGHLLLYMASSSVVQRMRHVI